MIDAAAADTWPQDGLLVVLVPAAFLLGLMLRRGLTAILRHRLAGAARFPVVELVAVGLAVAGWWWEVCNLGQMPSGVPADATSNSLRLVSHLILFAFLAAASWIDLRQRVIPDAITVPGVLAGLAWNTALPATLLPVGRPVERSFAPPMTETDVLGAFGPLTGVGLPDWVTGAAGLAVMLIVFAIWWWFGLPPAVTEPTAGQAEPWPRWLNPSIALGGGGGITAAWLGWQACLLACVLAVFIGLAHGLVQLVRHAESELPFGPSLCLGLAAVVIAWQPLWAATAAQFDRPGELAAVVTLVIAMTALTLAAWARLRGRVD